ncbi:MAG: metallophosphoesterase [Candidatus Tectomicrobia bacterium]|uniref:Metallophosphoesterase n=1 Tax=Tectimicrobiota bacterium TaxID=2528274 RepID=A0A932FVL6_UNCTE|nr:metallophosphoesterase [Candidatus Tectomicrobia bacterium]
MQIKIVSDIHGAYDELVGQLAPDDLLILLGDYAQLVDFQTLDGVLAQAFTREEVKQVLDWLDAGERGQARRFLARFAQPDGDRFPEVSRLVAADYRRMCARIPCKTYLLYGNTDYPWLLQEALGDHLELVAAGVVEIAGTKIGLVSGAPPMTWTFDLPGVLTEEAYRDRVASLGKVDILCSHVPPRVAELAYDVVARRDEMGSQHLLDYIREMQPGWAYFGHVHHPQAYSRQVGKTQAINVGCFRFHHQIHLHTV